MSAIFGTDNFNFIEPEFQFIDDCDCTIYQWFERNNKFVAEMIRNDKTLMNIFNNPYLEITFFFPRYISVNKCDSFTFLSQTIKRKLERNEFKDQKQVLWPSMVRGFNIMYNQGKLINTDTYCESELYNIPPIRLSNGYIYFVSSLIS